MLILEVLLGLKSKQSDVAAAFLHATLGPDEHVYLGCKSPQYYWYYCIVIILLCPAWYVMKIRPRAW